VTSGGHYDLARQDLDAALDMIRGYNPAVMQLTEATVLAALNDVHGMCMPPDAVQDWARELLRAEGMPDDDRHVRIVLLGLLAGSFIDTVRDKRMEH
jgi:hypothetical protein